MEKTTLDKNGMSYYVPGNDDEDSYRICRICGKELHVVGKPLTKHFSNHKSNLRTPDERLHYLFEFDFDKNVNHCKACGFELGEGNATLLEHLKTHEDLYQGYLEEKGKGGKKVQQPNIRKAVSLSVIETLLKNGELADVKDLDAFMEKYNANKHVGWQRSNRFDFLDTPAGEDETQLLIDYCNPELTIHDLMEKWEFQSSGSFYSKLGKAALKFTYQHKDLI